MVEVVFCLSGFLGTNKDWEILDLPYSIIHPTGDDLWEAGRSICETAKKTPSKEKILIGYSLGGRLALHALCLEPTLFSKAIIISAHTGLADPHEKKVRAESDALWAKRFQVEPWEAVMHDWNSQPIFSGHLLHRSATDYDRNFLAWQLTELSLGKQEDLLPKLSAIKTEILWITGERDGKFSLIAKQAVKHLINGKHWIFSGAGHRVPWENSADFVEKAQKFIFP